MAFNNPNQQQPQGGLRGQLQQPGQGGQQPGQKPGKPQKPLDGHANVNAGHMLPSAKDFDPDMDVSGFTGWTDVTPHVAGGAVQIVGGVRPPEGGDEEGDAPEGDQPDAQADKKSGKNPAKPGAKKAGKASRAGRFNWGDGDLSEVKDAK